MTAQRTLHPLSAAKTTDARSHKRGRFDHGLIAREPSLKRHSDDRPWRRIAVDTTPLGSAFPTNLRALPKGLESDVTLSCTIRKTTRVFVCRRKREGLRMSHLNRTYAGC